MSEGRKPRGRAQRTSYADDDFMADTAPDPAVAAAYAPTSAPLEQLARNPWNRRERYDDERTAELAASMGNHGQLQPVLVVSRDVYLGHYPEQAQAIGAARWVVITGNRRHAAAEIAGLARLDMVVRDHLGGDDPHMSEVMLEENIHREALPPLLEAAELQGLVERHGSQETVARRLSKSRGWVSQRLALLNLSPAMQAALRAEEITIREARAIANKPDQAAALAALRSPAPERAGEAPATRTAPGERPADGPAGAHQGRTHHAGTDGDTDRHGARATNGAPAPSAGTAARPDVGVIARDLRARLTADERAQLVTLLADDAPVTR